MYVAIRDLPQVPLHNYGIGGSTYKWIASWLSECSLYIRFTLDGKHINTHFLI